MTTPIADLTSSQLRRVADLREKIEALEQEFAGIIGGAAPAQAPNVKKVIAVPGKKKSRSFSPATLAKMRASQQARWAKANGGKAASAPAAKAKRTMSPEAKAKIAAAAKARWAKTKAA